MPEAQINYETICSKMALYSICFDKFVQYMALSDPKGKDSLLAIKLTYDSLFQELKSQVQLSLTTDKSPVKKSGDMKEHLKQTEQILSAAESLEKQNQ